MIAWTTLLACAACYGDPNSPLTHGANMAIFTMLGVTGTVLAGCGVFMAVLAHRAHRQAQFEAALDRMLKDTNV